MARILDISDGYTSATEPNQGNISTNQLKSFASSGAYATDKGSAAAAGDIFYNTTTSTINLFSGGVWNDAAIDSNLVHKTGDETIAGTKTFSNDVIVTGDFTVNGTTTTINTTNLEVEDKNININNGGTDMTSEGAGINVERQGTHGAIIYATAATSKFKCGDAGSEVEIATISGSQALTNKTIVAGSNTISGLLHGTHVDQPASGVHGVTGTIVGTTDTQVLTNKTFGDPTTPTKKMAFNFSGATADKTVTLISSHTDNRSITLPDETVTLQPKRLTTKGDLLVYTTTDTRLAAGTNGYILQANSSADAGMNWVAYNFTSPVAYTPTFSGMGTVSNINVISWRQGAFLGIRGYFTVGTSTASEARMTIGFNGTSANVTSDNSGLLPTISMVSIMAASTGNTLQYYMLIEPNKTYVTFSYHTTGVSGFTKQNGSAIFNSGESYSFSGLIPIDGWTV